MNLIKESSRKNLASDNFLDQIWGAILHNWWLLLLLLIFLIMPNLGYFPKANILGATPMQWYLFLSITVSVILLVSVCYSLLISFKQRGKLKGIIFCHLINLISIGLWMIGILFIFNIIDNHFFCLACITIFFILVVRVCNTLTKLFSVHQKEFGITWCQISILIAFGLWIIGFILIFNITKDSEYYVALGIVGGLLSYIFQDAIKGIASFLHLRLNHLLLIDDWIKVPKFNVDGMVKQITLTTVTVENWDTTTSSIPTSALHADHFINHQKMMEGKTYGRQMLKSFILDTSWFRPLTEKEVSRLQEKLNDSEHFFDETKIDSITQNVSIREVCDGMLNAQLYRYYIFHWLMNHPHVSQHPRLIVRWMNHTDGGMELQIYAFIIDSSLAAFEWQQSQIIEHIIETLDWFGLRLYQSPSAFDVSNSNVHLSDSPANYLKEVNHE